MGVGGVSGAVEKKEGRRRPRRTLWPVFVMYLLQTSLPLLLPPRFPLSSATVTGPHPSGEGRGACGWMAMVRDELR